MNWPDDNNNMYPNRYPNRQRLSYLTINRYRAYYGIPPTPVSMFTEITFPNDNIRKEIKHISSLLTDSCKDHDLVFVWDSDEITMMASNYIDKYEEMMPELNVRLLWTFIERILVCANFTSSDELFEGDIVNIEDLHDNGTELMKRLLPKYHDLAQIYNEISSEFREDGPIINYELVKKCRIEDTIAQEVYEIAARIQSQFNNRWQSTRKCLEFVNQKSLESNNKKYENVVLSREGVGFGAAQLLISGNSKEIPIENIYSISDVSKESVFERIQHRFGQKCTLIYITSFPEIAQKLKIPIWTVKASDSFEYLYNALRDVFLC